MSTTISYACAVLSSLSDPDGKKHSDKAIMSSIALALEDDGHNFRRKELRNALEWLYRRASNT